MPLANGLLYLVLNQSQLHDLGYAQGPVEAKKFARDFDENDPGLVFQFAATDPEGQPIRWELSGDDAADFSITEGTLSFSVTPDYENPADKNRDNIYQVTVEARDPGFNVAPADVTVTVLNADERGTVTLSTQTPQEEVGLSAELSDPDGITTQAQWQWSRSSDGLSGWTNISGAATRNYTPVEADVGGYLRAAATYEDAQSVDVEKTAHGISANPVLAKPYINQAPEFLDEEPVRTVNENAAADAPVGDPVAAEDPDDDPLTYALSAADAGSFGIDDSTGQISVPAETSLDFETKSSYAVTVTATDPSDESDSVDVTITVMDVNEPLDVTEGETDLEYAENGTDAVEQFVAVDSEGQDVSWRLSGDDANDFAITGGALTFNSSPDFENPADRGSNNVYNITVGASDTGGRLTEVDVTVTVTNVDEPGTVTLSSLEPEEGVRITAILADPDGIASNIRWQWARSSDGSTGWVDIDEATSGIYTPVPADADHYLRATANYEDRESATVTKTANAATDEPVEGIPYVNRAPTFIDADPTTRTVNENSAVAAAVGDPVEAEDLDNDVLVYVLSGDDADLFEVVAATGQITVGEGTSLNFEARRNYQVTLTVSDPSGASDTIDVDVKVTNVDEPPTIDLTVPGPEREDAAYQENNTSPVAGYTVGGQTEGFEWSLSGIDAGNFSISNSGVLTFNSPPDYENPTDNDRNNEYLISVNATDSDDKTGTTAVTVTVTDVNDTGEAAVGTYDQNADGTIDRDEALRAIRDYFSDVITKDEVLAVIMSYFIG